MTDEDTTTEDDVQETTTEDISTDTDTSQEGEADKDEEWDPERAKRKIAKLNSEAANLRRRVNEAPKADDIAAKDRKIGELETANLRYEVAFDLGLPKHLAKRLVGGTREELLADAEELVSQMTPAKRTGTRQPTTQLRGGGEPAAEPEETDPRKLAARVPRN